MIVSSTDFQQRVGYYLSIAEQGSEIYVERKKPGHTLFVLKIEPSGKPKSKRSKRLKALENARKLNMKFPGNDGVAFQRSIRR